MDGSVANNHSGRKSPKDRVVPLSKWPYSMACKKGGILTTYIHWDDPPTTVDGRNPKANHLGWC